MVLLTAVLSACQGVSISHKSFVSEDGTTQTVITVLLGRAEADRALAEIGRVPPGSDQEWLTLLTEITEVFFGVDRLSDTATASSNPENGYSDALQSPEHGEESLEFSQPVIAMVITEAEVGFVYTHTYLAHEGSFYPSYAELVPQPDGSFEYKLYTSLVISSILSAFELENLSEDAIAGMFSNYQAELAVQGTVNSPLPEPDLFDTSRVTWHAGSIISAWMNDQILSVNIALGYEDNSPDASENQGFTEAIFVFAEQNPLIFWFLITLSCLIGLFLTLLLFGRKSRGRHAK